MATIAELGAGTAEHDELGDVDVARELVKQAPGAELSLPRTGHLTAACPL